MKALQMDALAAFAAGLASAAPMPARPRRRTPIFIPQQHLPHRALLRLGHSRSPTACATTSMMLNARDGGINGARIVFEECETRLRHPKGVECYEQAKSRGSVLNAPWSTACGARQLIPRAHIDKIPILVHGLRPFASAVGETFPWVFNPPMTYWDGASVWISVHRPARGRLRQAARQDHRPRPSRRALRQGADPGSRGARQGARLHAEALSGEPDGNAEPVLHLARHPPRPPDWILLQGWGAMNPTAVREAGRAGFPRDKLLGVWWAGGDDDARPAGADGRGYLSISWHQVGTNFPVIQDILKHVVDKDSRSRRARRSARTSTTAASTRAILIAEAIRNAQQLAGKKVDHRRGHAARLRDASNISAAPLKPSSACARLRRSRCGITCADHNGHNAGLHDPVGRHQVGARHRLDRADRATRPAAARGCGEAPTSGSNQGWPRRTETCDQRS
jgi:branched-chain amino acid transport system substrate-binding protein